MPIERKTLAEMRKDLTKKQSEKFKKLMIEYRHLDKVDIIYLIAKKRMWRLFQNHD